MVEILRKKINPTAAEICAVAKINLDEILRYQPVPPLAVHYIETGRAYSLTVVDRDICRKLCIVRKLLLHRNNR